MSTRTPFRRRHGRITLTVVKDVILFGIGAGMIYRQGFVVPFPEFNLWAMIFGGVLANVPTAQYLWAMRSGSIGSPTSPPAPEPLPSPSPPSSGT